jgi:hypothetical protein
LAVRVYATRMREKIVRTFMKSLEWRVIALVVTNIFFWITTRHFWTAAGLAFLLQVILFACYLVWHFMRVEL